MKGFCSPAECESMVATMDDLAEGWDPAETKATFRTDEKQEHTQGKSDYFLSSSDKVARTQTGCWYRRSPGPSKIQNPSHWCFPGGRWRSDRANPCQPIRCWRSKRTEIISGLRDHGHPELRGAAGALLRGGGHPGGGR